MEQFEGVWVVIFCPNTKYVGKLAGEYALGTPGPSSLFEAGYVRLEEAYELVVVTQVGKTERGQMGTNRMAFCQNVSDILDSAPIYVGLAGAQIMYLDEMSKADRGVYEGLVRSAMKDKVAAKGRRSGLEITDTMPNSIGKGKLGVR